MEDFFRGAVRTLHANTQKYRERIDRLEKENAELKARLDNLESLMAKK